MPAWLKNLFRGAWNVVKGTWAIGLTILGLNSTEWGTGAVKAVVAVAVFVVGGFLAWFDGMKPIGATAIALASVLVVEFVHWLIEKAWKRSFDLRYFKTLVRVTVTKRGTVQVSNLYRCVKCGTVLTRFQFHGSDVDRFVRYRCLAGCRSDALMPMASESEHAIRAFIQGEIERGRRPWDGSWVAQQEIQQAARAEDDERLIASQSAPPR